MYQIKGKWLDIKSRTVLSHGASYAVWNEKDGNGNDIGCIDKMTFEERLDDCYRMQGTCLDMSTELYCSTI